MENRQNILPYEDFKCIFENVISDSGKDKFNLIDTIGLHPYRYLGIFRSLKPKSKILHNIFQSHEIKFGNALEAVITKYFELLGYEILENKFKIKNPIKNKYEKLNVDIFFKKDNNYFLIEQKVRDDHDSSKKTGQLNNFEAKIDYVLENILNENSNLESFFYFVDPSMKKNTSFYKDELERISSYRKSKVYLAYGEELFKHLDILKVWEEIKTHLTRWHFELEDIPNLNFDLNSEVSFKLISKLKTNSLINFFNNKNTFYNEKIWIEIIPVFFPTGKTIELLIKDFKESKHVARNSLAKDMEEKFFKK